MKTFKEFLEESSLSRIKSKSDKGGMAVISGSRGDKSAKENEIESRLSEGYEIESRINLNEEKTEVSTVQDINQGRVIIRLRPINELQNTVDDLELRDGDILTIPQKKMDV